MDLLTRLKASVIEPPRWNWFACSCKCSTPDLVRFQDWVRFAVAVAGQGPLARD